MNRIAQGLTLVLLGAAALTSTVATDLYLNWVKPGFGPFLVAAGVVMVLLGVLVIVAELRGEGKEASGGDTAEEPSSESHHEHGHGGHDHSRAPRVAWLLLLPVIAVFVVAPPALGAYTVENTAAASPPPPEQRGSVRFDDGIAEAEPGEVVEMDVRQFVMRAWLDEERLLAGQEVELTGFAVPDPEGEGWFLARLQMSCCAADAIVNKVHITNRPAPETDSWWTVRGTWIEPEGEISHVSQHEFEVLEMREVSDTPDPYEW
ncbi:TIGR03943 family putative permease subunit [Nocardiopsis halotolerans]|uniref:TIGR03943 family putative permease subunit n=1 Tax=Nocardiopsis halotolerans TaxID=124252 RepID=UPI000346F2F3|nr:TIGR03943 family protein [Nocardiopsis halotolerans]